MPSTLKQSPRFGVRSRSKEQSGKSRSAASAAPAGASAGNSMIPSESSPRPSSAAEQSIPLDSTPRIFARFSFMPLGNVVPTGANGLFRPGRTLGAPQTTSTCSPPAPATWQTLSRSAPGCFATSTISPTTTPSRPSPWRSSSSTSWPIMVSRWASVSVSMDGSTHSRNHFSENFIVRTDQLNWRRKRRSFSKNVLRSRTPYRSMARRSIPMPNA